MRWVTRDDLTLERIACCWLITRFIDYKAELIFVADEYLHRVDHMTAVAFDLDDSGDCDASASIGFEALLMSFGLGGDLTLLAMADAVRDAGRDTSVADIMPNGLQMLARGFETMGANCRQLLRQGFLFCDAIYVGICEHVGMTGWSGVDAGLPPVRRFAPGKPRRPADGDGPSPAAHAAKRARPPVELVSVTG